MTSNTFPWLRFLGAASLAFVVLTVRPSEAANPECVESWGEARYRSFGYDHIVHVRNRCDHPAVCDVSTDVNPDPTRITVAPAEEAQVLTFRGSPAREFAVRAVCHLSE